MVPTSPLNRRDEKRQAGRGESRVLNGLKVPPTQVHGMENHVCQVMAVRTAAKKDVELVTGADKIEQGALEVPQGFESARGLDREPVLVHLP